MANVGSPLGRTSIGHGIVATRTTTAKLEGLSSLAKPFVTFVIYADFMIPWTGLYFDALSMDYQLAHCALLFPLVSMQRETFRPLNEDTLPIRSHVWCTITRNYIHRFLTHNRMGKGWQQAFFNTTTNMYYRSSTRYSSFRWLPVYVE